ncbi:hypothetical protein Ahy_A07g036704 isoform A [Arachis hypogaea]|uniref:Exostosin GT47 domain-containing protein n=1 Tax=Arachis hypogaea TaxID=3818 RepID=A0A445CGU5_ARAHY|nr:hypothetical protein Ahy_A07g036704 isoform A [Arachis hypogaea]
MLMSSTVKQTQQLSPNHGLFSLRGALLTLAILTLLSFTFLSLKYSTPSPQISVAKLVDPEVKEHNDEEEGGEELSDIYHSPRVFKLNYAEMMEKFKVYIYPDGDPKTFYQTPRKLTGKYASEGYFFQNIRESRFRTLDPDQAHLFFIPISCHKMRGKGTSYDNMTIIVQNYVEGLIAKYPYWNRTLGADHFFVTCHDVGVRATEGLPFLIKNTIRAVCSPSYDVGFIPHKDVALPQVLQPFALPAGGNDIENSDANYLIFPGMNRILNLEIGHNRQTTCLHEYLIIYSLSTFGKYGLCRTNLGFWAGHRNSKIRVILARVWENDTELDISNNRISRATGHLVYQKRFYKTKFCICPGGSQVNSARIADSIHYGCIPVILSNYYDLPFNDIVDWRKFAVVLKESDVYQLKQILKNISHAEFVSLHNNLVKIQKHFQWNTPPISYDAFHMVMYDLWLRHYTIKY